MPTDPALDLLEVLKKERAALLAADLVALDQMQPRKEAALAELGGKAIGTNLRRRIDRAVRHNQYLLLAVRDGLTQTLDLLRGIAQQPTAQTYGPDGQRKSLQDHGVGLSRKF